MSYSSNSTLGFQEYGMANASNFSRGFTPASNPERGNNIMGNAIGVYLSKKGALYRIWCGVNRLGDIGVKVV